MKPDTITCIHFLYGTKYLVEYGTMGARADPCTDFPYSTRHLVGYGTIEPGGVVMGPILRLVPYGTRTLVLNGTHCMRKGNPFIVGILI